MKPTPYDLREPSELTRLMREIEGYLRTCKLEHHGTDVEGREHALLAIRQINRGERPIKLDRIVDVPIVLGI